MTESSITHTEAPETGYCKPGSAGFVLANTEYKVRLQVI